MKMRASVMGKTTQNDEKSLEERYQEQIRENLRMSREIRRKELEIENLKEKYENLQNILKDERKEFCKERREWNSFKDDMLLVVRAADDYKTDAMKTVEKYKSENSAIKLELSASKKTLELPCSCRRVGTIDSQTWPRPKKVDVISSSEDTLSLDCVDSCSSMNVKKGVLPCENKENVNLKNNEDVELKSHNSQNGNFIKRFNGVSSASNNIADCTSLLETNPLITFMKIAGGSKRNALLRWCQNRTKGYNYVDITNFSTSWSDGLALNALLHSYLPDLIPYSSLRPENSRENFEIAFRVAEEASIPPSLNIEDMLSNDRPSWEKVMNYVKDIYAMLGHCDQLRVV